MTQKSKSRMGPKTQKAMDTQASSGRGKAVADGFKKFASEVKSIPGNIARDVKMGASAGVFSNREKQAANLARKDYSQADIEDYFARTDATIARNKAQQNFMRKDQSDRTPAVTPPAVAPPAPPAQVAAPPAQVVASPAQLVASPAQFPIPVGGIYSAPTNAPFTTQVRPILPGNPFERPSVVQAVDGLPVSPFARPSVVQAVDGQPVQFAAEGGAVRSAMMQNNIGQTEDARLSVPDGGIASFVPDDDEIDDVEDFGSQGIAQFPELAQRMAAMGRGGDDTLAHVQRGELIIPAALLAQDPALKEGLFQRLRDMGIEDPERYVVGSEENSLNPETGIPEFFLKKLFRGIKKAVKKIATVVLPIALAFTPLGPIFGSALGSGVATLINGGSFKDALKSAAITGLTAGVFQGVTGGQGSFGANVKSALTDPIGRLGQTVSGLGSTVTGGGFTGAGNLFTPYAAPSTVSLSTSGGPAAVVNADPIAEVATDAVSSGKPPGFVESIKGAFTPGDDIGFGEGMKNAFFPQAGAVDTTAIGNKAYTSAFKNAIDLGMTETAASQIGIKAMENAVSSATAAAAPGFLRTYAPLALAGTALAAGTGMFDPVPGEAPGLVQYGEDGRPITGTDLVAQNPSDYMSADIGTMVLDPITGQYVPKLVSSSGIYGNLYQTTGDQVYTAPNFSVPTNAPFTPGGTSLTNSIPRSPFVRPSVVQAAEGGAIFPRRNGGIMPDEGTPGKDSVRAMLMPGEFVMTTNAVRGLGGGNLNNGIKNMYSVMRNLESRGRAMA
jgi:hypothetical protein